MHMQTQVHSCRHEDARRQPGLSRTGSVAKGRTKLLHGGVQEVISKGTKGGGPCHSSSSLLCSTINFFWSVIVADSGFIKW
mmetsp:Transcript_29908/g.95385  ORF Transcript_29908/g.95385 Transcript_29908/m.95385 type:complete len:81 (-) Transcript_29908:1253-1495(-)